MNRIVCRVGSILTVGAWLALAAGDATAAGGPSRGAGHAGSRSAGSSSHGPSSAPSISRTAGSSFRGGSPGGGSLGGSGRSISHAPSISHGTRSFSAPSNSFRAHPSPGNLGSHISAGPSQGSRIHSLPSTGGSHSLPWPSSGISSRSQWHGGDLSGPSHSKSGPRWDRSWADRPSGVSRWDGYRDLMLGRDNNAHRYDYPSHRGPNDWYRDRDWYHNRDWYHDRDWWRPYHGYGYHRPFHVIWPFWYPRWYAYYPFYRPWFYFSSYDYGYPTGSYYDYGDLGYYGDAGAGYYGNTNAVYYSTGYAPTAETAASYEDTAGEPISAQAADASQGADDNSAGRRFFADALAAFRQKDYRQAARMANHAMIEMPQESQIHELLSLALFAMGDYRGATMEAHAALAQGAVGDWPRLYSYYQDQPTYAKQLNALEEYLKKSPSSLDARFVLGYHYVMLGHLQDAKRQLTPVVNKAPWDKVAVQLFKQAGGEATSLPANAGSTPAAPPGPSLGPMSAPARPSGPTPSPMPQPAGPQEF